MSSDDESDSSDESEDWHDKRSPNQARIECFLLNLTAIAWSADNALLPAVFKEISNEFDVDATALSILVLLRGVSESVFSFPSGFLADMLPRPMLICIGCMIWGLGLAGCAAAPSFYFVCAARVVNGVGLGIVMPLLNSLVADTTAPSKRGISFGMLQFTGAMGATFGSLLATSLAPLVIFGVAGWRFVLYTIALFSALVGVAVYFLVGEPRAKIQDANKSFVSVFVNNMPKVCGLFKVKTFILVLLQGAPGTIPWFAFSFLTMFLELSCFSNANAAQIYMFFGFGNAASGLVGGLALDFIVRRFPDRGPPALMQLCVGIGIPLLGLIFFGMPGGEGATNETIILYCSVFFTFGLLVSYGGVINAKIFADIVPQAIFTYVYAVDATIEGTVGASGSVLVGMLTDKVFHYNATAAELGECSPNDAHKLGEGVFTITLVSWSICFLFYSLMHCTYPEDRKRMIQQFTPGKGAQPIVSCADPADSDSGTEAEPG